MWKHAVDDEQGSMEERAKRIERDYYVSMVICFMITVPFAILFITPYYINKMIVVGLNDSEMGKMKLCYWVACLFFVLAWMLQSCYPKENLHSLNLKPHQDEKDQDSDEEEEMYDEDGNLISDSDDEFGDWDAEETTA
jgi:hypothetical protein